MIRKSGLCLLIILLAALKSGAKLDAVVAHSIFYVPDPVNAGKYVPQVEAYWQINQRTVHYKTDENKMIVGKIGVDIVFMNTSGIIKHDRFIIETTPRANPSDLARNRITDLRRYDVLDGQLKMRIIFADINDSTSKFVYNDSFTVVPHEKEAFYSDIELLDTILASDEASPFKKNNQQLIPACTNFIDDHHKHLFYYEELYGSATLPAADFPLMQKVYIGRRQDDDILGNPSHQDTFASARNIIGTSGSLDLSTEGSGNYYVITTLQNKQEQILQKKTYFFQLLNPNPVKVSDSVANKRREKMDSALEKVQLLDLNKTFVAKYSTAEIRSILKMLLPFSDFNATNTINGFLKNPDDGYMRYYVYNFFSAINRQDPGKAWKDFSEKIIQVNKLFSASGKKGFTTDRGFMYLRYGPPTEVITVENEQGALPYEIWQYNTLERINHKSMANAVFLFYRPSEAEDFRLLHSTVPEETQNIGWRNFLYTNAQGGNNGNSRAEQYLQQ